MSAHTNTCLTFSYCTRHGICQLILLHSTTSVGISQCQSICYSYLVVPCAVVLQVVADGNFASVLVDSEEAGSSVVSNDGVGDSIEWLLQHPIHNMSLTH